MSFGVVPGGAIRFYFRMYIFMSFFFSVRVVTESGDVYRQMFASCRTRAKALSHMRGFDGC